jgi:ATP-dependent DNA helicase RecG
MTSALPLHIDDLLTCRTVESPRVEFKASWDDATTGWQVVRTICAFANDLHNLNGGYVVLGVAARDGIAELPPAGIEGTALDGIQRKIRGMCKTIDPEYQPVMSPQVVGNKHVLVLWVPASQVRPHQAPESGQRGASKRYWVRVGSETVVAQSEILTALMQQTAKVPFDDRLAPGVPVERLREGRVREFLTDVRSDLVHEREARAIYRQMRICAPSNGHEAPVNIGLLFFTDDPEEWFRGARIELAQFADDAGSLIQERVFRGPVHEQLRRCIEHLRSLAPQFTEKVEHAAEARSWYLYPLPALEEAMANALYHRSYENLPEPTKVYVYADRIEVISYPGPVHGIERYHLRPGARVPPVPLRNRRIGELLKELRLAEARGTGVPKMFRAMAANGSPPPEFDFDAARTYFRVTLRAHPRREMR